MHGGKLMIFIRRTDLYKG